MNEADKIREAEKQKAENEKQQLEKTRAFKRLFATDDGKVVLEDLEAFCNFRRPSYNEQHPNALQTHINEGKRRVYLRIDGFLRKKEND